MFAKILKIFLLIVIISLLVIPLANKCFAQSSIWDFATDTGHIKEALNHMQDGSVNINDVKYMAIGLTDFLLAFVVLFGVIFLIIGGYQYMASAGNPDQIQKAKNTITYSIIGIAVAGLARAIINFAKGSVANQADIRLLVIQIISQILIFVIGIAVLFIIVGGYQYITSTGNPDRIQRAKATITYAITGLVIAILSRTIATFVFDKLKNEANLTKGLIEQMITTVLSVVSFIAVLFLIIGGYQYMTSSGNPDQIQKAKNTILYSIIGLIVIILSAAIVSFIRSVLKI